MTCTICESPLGHAALRPVALCHGMNSSHSLPEPEPGRSWQTHCHARHTPCCSQSVGQPRHTHVVLATRPWPATAPGMPFLAACRASPATATSNRMWCWPLDLGLPQPLVCHIWRCAVRPQRPPPVRRRGGPRGSLPLAVPGGDLHACARH